MYEIIEPPFKERYACTKFRVLLNQYENQTICTNWNGVCSDAFNVTNGIRPDGVLSPLVFTVYFNELIDQLKGN